MPVADAREVMDKPGVWDEINVVAAATAPPRRCASGSTRSSGAGVEVDAADQEREEIQDQLASLDVVLYFFSGIALFVGGFLILNSFNMTVLQRMREIGTLRALGARAPVVTRHPRRGDRAGVLGTSLGLGLGVGLAAGLVALMRGRGACRSRDYEYRRRGDRRVVTGLVATLLGAAWPARRAGPHVADPRAARRRATPHPAPRRGDRPGALPAGRRARRAFWFGDTSGAARRRCAGIAATMAMFLGMVGSRRSWCCRSCG